MKKTIILVLAFVAGMVFAEFRAGFARVDATPPLGLPCEPFVDIGRAVKARSPFRMTVFTCLTNGSEGYIASTKAHAEGGYEALSSRFAAPTGDRLVKAQLDQLTALKGAARKEP